MGFILIKVIDDTQHKPETHHTEWIPVQVYKDKAVAIYLVQAYKCVIHSECGGLQDETTSFFPLVDALTLRKQIWYGRGALAVEVIGLATNIPARWFTGSWVH